MGSPMKRTLDSSQFQPVTSAASQALPDVEKFLRMMLYHGPRQLLTSRISGKCAAVMVAMCSPALLFCSLLTLPTLLFRSPEQHAYFYFSRLINEDPSRWLVLMLAWICALMSLAIPATMAIPRSFRAD
jgi:hypothetical protein